MSKSAYSEQQVAELMARPGGWDFASVNTYAGVNGLKPASVRAKIISLKLPYESKPKTTKSGEPVIGKAAIVAVMEAALGVNFASAVKMSKSDLQTLAARLSVLVEPEEVTGN